MNLSAFLFKKKIIMCKDILAVFDVFFTIGFLVHMIMGNGGGGRECLSLFNYTKQYILDAQCKFQNILL